MMAKQSLNLTYESVNLTMPVRGFVSSLKASHSSGAFVLILVVWSSLWNIEYLSAHCDLMLIKPALINF